MEFTPERIALHSQGVGPEHGNPASGYAAGHVEVVTFDVVMPQAVQLIYEIALNMYLPVLVGHMEILSVDAMRPAHMAPQMSPAARPSRSARTSGSSSSTTAAQDLLPLVIVPRRRPHQWSAATDDRAGSRVSQGAPFTIVVPAYGVCHNSLRVTLKFSVASDASEAFLAHLEEVVGPVAAEGFGIAPFIVPVLRRTLRSMRVEAMPLVRAPVTASHLLPLLNASQHLRAAGPAHLSEATEADLLAGLALMRSRKFVQCKELWQRCARELLQGVGLSIVPCDDTHGRSAASSSSASLPADTMQEVIADAGGSLFGESALSIRPFGHRISASFDGSVHRAIFLQVLIANCMIEHSGGPLQDQNLSAVLSALHLATQLHLIDLHSSTTPRQLTSLGPRHDAQTVLLSLQPHVVHLLCAVVTETLKSRTMSQWSQVVASALRCLDFVVHTSVSCALEPLVLDTIVRCFNCCDGEANDDPRAGEAAALGVMAMDPAAGTDDIRTALHHLVETCHDVLPSVSSAVLQTAARSLVDHIVGSRSQRNWPYLHVHLLRFLMRIVVLVAGDVSPVVLGKGNTEGTMPFLDYLLQLLSAIRADDHAEPLGDSLDASAASNLGMPFLAWRCWSVLRTHLLPCMPRLELLRLVHWLACSLSDSRSSYPVALELLLSVITDLAHAVSQEGASAGAGQTPGKSSDWHAPAVPDVEPEEPGGQWQTSATDAVLRIHRARCSIAGTALHPLIQPLRDWLLLLTGKRSALHGCTELTGEDLLWHSNVSTRRVTWRAFSSASQGLSTGLVGCLDREGGLEEEEDGLEFEEEDFPHKNVQLGRSTGSWHSVVGSANRRPHPSSEPHLTLSPDSPGDGSSSSSCRRRGAWSPPPCSESQSEEAFHAEPLLRVWRTVVAVVGVLPVSSRPKLHDLAKPVLERMRQLCLQGSPQKHSLQVMAQILKDLPCCTDAAAADFVRQLLLAFCEWVPHSVLDETFAVLEHLLRLLGSSGLDKLCTATLMHALLNQYTARSKAQRQSQQALIQLLMAPTHCPEQCADTTGAQAQEAHRPSVAPLDADATSGSLAAEADDGQEEQQEVQDEAETEEDITHFKGILRLCFAGLTGWACESKTLDADTGAVAEATLEPEHDSLQFGGLELVDRLHFLSLVFRNLRRPHLLFVVDNMDAVADAMSNCLAHPQEKVRLLSIDLLQNLSSAAFDRFSPTDRLERYCVLLQQVVHLTTQPLPSKVVCSTDVSEADGLRTNGSAVKSRYAGTSAVVLASCHLLHSLPSYRFLRRWTGGKSASIAASISAPLLHLLASPLQLVRIAAFTAIVAWLPKMVSDPAPEVVHLLAEAVAVHVNGDYLGRLAAATLLASLVKAGQIETGKAQEWRQVLSSDWNLNVNEAAELTPVDTEKHPGGEPAESIAFLSNWSECMWESVYVNEVPAVCSSGIMAGNALLDRFEDFLDACDAADNKGGVSRGGSKDVRHGVYADHAATMQVNPDPELTAMFGLDTNLCHADDLPWHGRAPATSAVGLHQQQAAAVGAGRQYERIHEEEDEEEDLGIIDAGNEEWMEVLDIIQERSAVTIFNHTDSTWYVSQKHPNLIRPLHGKRRHPLTSQQRQRSPSPADVGIVTQSGVTGLSTARAVAHRGHRHTVALPRRVGGSPDTSPSARSPPAPGPMQVCVRRRPHSAPNRMEPPHWTPISAGAMTSAGSYGRPLRMAVHPQDSRAAWMTGQDREHSPPYASPGGVEWSGPHSVSAVASRRLSRESPAGSIGMVPSAAAFAPSYNVALRADAHSEEDRLHCNTPADFGHERLHCQDGAEPQGEECPSDCASEARVSPSVSLATDPEEDIRAEPATEEMRNSGGTEVVSEGQREEQEAVCPDAEE